MKSRTTIWIALALLIAFCVGGVAFALINLNAYLSSQRPWLEQTTSKLLAREVHFDDISVSLSGGLGVRVSNPQISDDPAHSDEVFLSADAIEVHISLWAAINGGVEIRRATLVAPTLRLHHSESSWNFDSLGAPPDGETEASSAEGGPDAAEILISVLQITNGTLLYNNSRGEQPYTIEATRVEASAREWRPGEPFQFEAKGVLHGADSHNTRISVSLTPKAHGDRTGLDIELELIAHEAARLIELAPVARLLPDDVEASGPVDAVLKLTGPTHELGFDAHLNVARVAVASNFLDKAAESPMDLRLLGTLSKEVADISSFTLVGPNLSLEAKGKLLRTEPAELEFEAHSAEIPLNALGLHRELVPPESDQFEILRKVKASGQLTFAAESGPTGKIGLQSSAGFWRGVRYESLGIDIELGAGRVRSVIRSASGGVGPVPYETLELDLSHAGGRFELKQGVARLLGGELRASGHTQMVDSLRRSQLEAHLSGARAEILDELLRGENQRNAEGLLTAHVNLTGTGSSWEDFSRSLAATGAVRIEEGVLNNVNLSEGAIEAIIAVPVLSTLFSKSIRDPDSEIFDSNDTRFETIDIGINVANAVAQSEEIQIRTKAYKIVGRGSVTLEGVVDANAILTFSQRITNQMGPSGKLIAGLLNPAGLLAIPVRIVGTLPNIETQADPAHIARTLKKELFVDPLKGLMGGADSLMSAPSRLKKK